MSETQDERVTCPACDGGGRWDSGSERLRAYTPGSVFDVGACGLCVGSGTLPRHYATELRDALDAVLGERGDA